MAAAAVAAGQHEESGNHPAVARLVATGAEAACLEEIMARADIVIATTGVKKAPVANCDRG
jgi:hypothetical protein